MRPIQNTVVQKKYLKEIGGAPLPLAPRQQNGPVKLRLGNTVLRSRVQHYFPAVLFIILQYSVLVDAVSPYLSAGHDTGPVQHVQGDVNVDVLLYMGPDTWTRDMNMSTSGEHEHGYKSGK